MIPTFLHHENNEPLDFAYIKVRCLKPSRLQGWRGKVFFWVRTPNFQLLENILFRDTNGNEWLVPKGYVFNGLSVPWELWWLCPPTQGEAFAASAVHDFLCDTKPVDHKEAAQIFHDAMIANGMYPFGAKRNRLGCCVLGPKFKAKQLS